MLSNLVCIGFSVMSTFKNLQIMAIARFGFGLGSGIIVAAAPKLLEETVPAHLIDKGFGCSTNILINVGVMLNSLIANGNPDNTDYSALKHSSFWRVIYGFGILPCLISFLMFLFFHKEDALIYLIEHEQEDETDKVLARVYSAEDKDTRDQIKSNLRQQLKA